MCTKGNMHLSACALLASSCTDISGKLNLFVFNISSVRATLCLLVPNTAPLESELMIITILCRYMVKDKVEQHCILL